MRLATLPNFDCLIDTSGHDEGVRPVEVDGGAEMRVSVQPLRAPPERVNFTNIFGGKNFLEICSDEKLIIFILTKQTTFLT